MKKILINIAGLNFSLHIETIIRPFYQKALLNTIHQVLGSYIIQEGGTFSEKSTIKLFFRKKPSWEFVKDTGNSKKQYYSFYYEEQNDRYNIHYSIGVLQLQFLLKRIVEKALYKQGGIILHCSSCIYNKQTFVFVAKRTGGKSTILGMFLKAGAEPICDDNAIIIKRKNQFILYQTPFIETNFAFKKTNKSYPIHNFMFLKKSEDNTIETDIKYSNILSMLGKQVLVREWWGKEQSATLMKLAKTKSFYMLHFSKSISKFKQFLKKKPFS